MIRDDFKVAPRSWDNIRAGANTIRTALGLAQTPYVPVIDVIERVMDYRLRIVRFEIGDRKEMGGAEGYTCPNGEFIMLREDVYEKACDGEGRARFTVAHELGHFVLHTNVPLARARRGDGTPHYSLAEPQANQFAAEFLMPDGFISSFDNEEELMKRFGVSREAAANRLRYLRKKGSA